jgi:hypothetical protein
MIAIKDKRKYQRRVVKVLQKRRVVKVLQKRRVVKVLQYLLQNSKKMIQRKL